jgi:hypothetical protein
MALSLAIPAATVYGAEQTVEVQVLQPGFLGVEVDAQGGFGPLIPGKTGHWGFKMSVTNTTDPAGGWVVTVDSNGDFTSGNWSNCDQNGCTGWDPDGADLTIAASALSITGGDLPWWDDHDPLVIVPGAGTFGSGPITVETGKAEAWGQFWINEPSPELTLVVPNDTALIGHNFMTTLTYTIAANP